MAGRHASTFGMLADIEKSLSGTCSRESSSVNEAASPTRAYHISPLIFVALLDEHSVISHLHFFHGGGLARCRFHPFVFPCLTALLLFCGVVDLSKTFRFGISEPFLCLAQRTLKHTSF